jgi:hypothetical protein
MKKVVQSDSDPLNIFERWAEGHPRCPEFVGKSRSDAIETARQTAQAENMRIMDLDLEQPSRWTMDLRPDRLNIVVREGTVIAAALF